MELMELGIRQDHDFSLDYLRNYRTSAAFFPTLSSRGLLKDFAVALYLADALQGVSDDTTPTTAPIFCEAVMSKFPKAYEARADEKINAWTIEEANHLSREAIMEDITSFSTSWLEGLTGIPSMVFETIQENIGYEGPVTRQTFEALVEATCGWDELVETAINHDGYGEYLNSYDGDSFECTVFEKVYIVCRMDSS